MLGLLGMGTVPGPSKRVTVSLWSRECPLTEKCVLVRALLGVQEWEPRPASTSVRGHEWSLAPPEPATSSFSFNSPFQTVTPPVTMELRDNLILSGVYRVS